MRRLKFAADDFLRGFGRVGIRKKIQTNKLAQRRSLAICALLPLISVTVEMHFEKVQRNNEHRRKKKLQAADGDNACVFGVRFLPAASLLQAACGTAATSRGNLPPSSPSALGL